jgi:hypothetical protein
MGSNKRILIVENQLIQFKEIGKLLDNEGYESFPSESSFKDYLDAIRIYLNPRYTFERRTLFLEKLLNMSAQFNPAILIIDHILVGTHNAQDGIDLAMKFREKGFKQPIIFFSRTEMNNIDVCDKLPKVSLAKEWVFKGYSGAEILDPGFFKKEVIKRIEELLSKSTMQKSELYVSAELIPFVNELLKIKLEANSRAVDLDRTTSISLLEKLKQKIEDFSTAQKNVSPELKNEFDTLKLITNEAHFEDDNWKLACNNLINTINSL